MISYKTLIATLVLLSSILTTPAARADDAPDEAALVEDPFAEPPFEVPTVRPARASERRLLTPKGTVAVRAGGGMTNVSLGKQSILIGGPFVAGSVGIASFMSLDVETELAFAFADLLDVRGRPCFGASSPYVDFRACVELSGTHVVRGDFAGGLSEAASVDVRFHLGRAVAIDLGVEQTLGATLDAGLEAAVVFAPFESWWLRGTGGFDGGGRALAGHVGAAGGFVTALGDTHVELGARADLWAGEVTTTSLGGYVALWFPAF